MQDTRSNGRNRAMLGAQIVYNNRQSTLDCQIRNISDKGARLSLSDTVTVPDEFDLLVPHRGRTYRARLRWRARDSIGVEFAMSEEPAARAEHTFDPAHRIAELETENARLQAKIAELSRLLEAANGSPDEKAA